MVAVAAAVIVVAAGAVLGGAVAMGAAYGFLFGAMDVEDAAEKLRTEERATLLGSLPSTGDDSKTAALLARCEGIGHHALKELADYCNDFSGELAEPMAKIQTELRALWEELRLPEPRRAKYTASRSLAP